MSIVGQKIANAPLGSFPVLSDTVGDSRAQLVKLDFGAIGASDMVTLANGLPVQIVAGGGGSPTLPATATMSRPPMLANATSQILAANTARKKAIVMNNTANTQWIKEGVIGVLSEGFPLYSGGYYNVVTTAAVHGWNAGGAVTLDALEAV